MQAAKIGAMTVEVGLLVFVGSYVILLCTIRAVTRRRAAAQQAKRTLNSMRAEFEKSRIGEPTRQGGVRSRAPGKVARSISIAPNG